MKSQILIQPKEQKNIEQFSESEEAETIELGQDDNDNKHNSKWAEKLSFQFQETSCEDFSTKTLTPAINLLPKSAKSTACQLGRCLENVRVDKKFKMLGQPRHKSGSWKLDQK